MKDEILDEYFTSGVSLNTDEGYKQDDNMTEEEREIRDGWLQEQTEIYLFARIREIKKDIEPQMNRIKELERRISLMNRRNRLIAKGKRKYVLPLDKYIHRVVLSGLDEILED